MKFFGNTVAWGFAVQRYDFVLLSLFLQNNSKNKLIVRLPLPNFLAFQ